VAVGYRPTWMTNGYVPAFEVNVPPTR
jgi:hypothetical protein